MSDLPLLDIDALRDQAAASPRTRRIVTKKGLPVEGQEEEEKKEGEKEE